MKSFHAVVLRAVWTKVHVDDKEAPSGPLTQWLGSERTHVFFLEEVAHLIKSFVRCAGYLSQVVWRG